jgi:hypothetical protein
MIIQHHRARIGGVFQRPNKGPEIGCLRQMRLRKPGVALAGALALPQIGIGRQQPVPGVAHKADLEERLRPRPVIGRKFRDPPMPSTRGAVDLGLEAGPCRLGHMDKDDLARQNLRRKRRAVGHHTRQHLIEQRRRGPLQQNIFQRQRHAIFLFPSRPLRVHPRSYPFLAKPS